MKNSIGVKILGHVMIYEDDVLILDVMNAIHPQNMATAIARSLARDSDGVVFSMSFGNGGTFVNSSAQTVRRPPNTLGAATLYNETYEVQVDEQTVGTPSTNSVNSSQSTSPAITSVVAVTAQLGTNEPEPAYTFDEIGLKTADGLLLSHLVFNPVLKTEGKSQRIVYNLLVSVS